MLPDDAKSIDAFNRTADRRVRLKLSLLPEPWVGRLTAPAVLLNLNPGIGSGSHNSWFKRPELVNAIRANLAQEPRREFPFHYLDPALAQSGGGIWWGRALRQLVADAGLQKVARRIVTIEYHGYHSYGFTLLPITLPSQRYTFAAVRRALDRDAVVIAMRGWRYWSVAVPELLDYSRLYRTSNPQVSSISPKNCPRGFDPILEAIS